MPQTKTIVFKCPGCDKVGGLQERLEGVTRYSNCVGFHGKSEIEYGDTDLETDLQGGEVTGYCCDCGYQIFNDFGDSHMHGFAVRDEEGLFDWLRRKGMLED